MKAIGYITVLWFLTCYTSFSMIVVSDRFKDHQFKNIDTTDILVIGFCMPLIVPYTVLEPTLNEIKAKYAKDN